jgi:hypothetical protein
VAAGQRLQRHLVLLRGQLGGRPHQAVGLVDRDHVHQLQQAALDPLQLVAGPGQHQGQEAVGHVGHHRLGLADADRLD